MDGITSYQKLQDQAERIRDLAENMEKRRNRIDRHRDRRIFDLYVAKIKELPWQKKLLLPLWSFWIYAIGAVGGSSFLYIFFHGASWTIPVGIGLLIPFVIITLRYERRVSREIKRHVIGNDGLSMVMSRMTLEMDIWLDNVRENLPRFDHIETDEMEDTLLRDLVKLKQEGWKIYDAANDLLFLHKSASNKDVIALVDLAKTKECTDPLKEALSPFFALVEQRTN